MFEEKIHNNKLSILGKLTAGLIHEIRNPLSVIKLNLDFLTMENNDLSGEMSECIESSKEALERIEKLVDTINEFSRKNPKSETLTNLNDITIKSVGVLKSISLNRNIKISYEPSNSFPNLYFDKNKMLQILLNLLHNALQACDDGGAVAIKIFFNDDNALIWQVEDNGIGIADEIKEEIFNEFFTSKKDGTGLGLSVCKMLLDEYYSDLKFESKLGEGSKFYIRFNSNLLEDTQK
jgi:signal transduction histidine kinase